MAYNRESFNRKLIKRPKGTPVEAKMDQFFRRLL
jgi:hypothetical protein